MWPWEHAALGYLLYSLGLRALGREPPSDGGAVVLLFGTQLPDLLDKPLSWQFGVFETGYALGHSALFAVPIGIGAIAFGRRTDRPRLGVAFVVGYWSHLLSDVLTPLRYGGSPEIERILWPIATTAPYEQDLGIGRGIGYFEDFLIALQAMDSLTVFLLYLLLPLGTVLLWIKDGAPGVALIGRGVRSIRRRTRARKR